MDKKFLLIVGSRIEILCNQGIELTDIREAAELIRLVSGSEAVRALPPVERQILGYILLNSPSRQTAFEWYRSEVAPTFKIGNSIATFSQYLNKIETLGLIGKKTHGRTRGRGHEVQLIIPDEVQDDVERGLTADDTPLPLTPFQEAKQ